MFIDVPTFAELNDRLDELIEREGRRRTDVKRSLMLPFEDVHGGKAVDTLSAYVEAGCERFMVQILDYEDPRPMEYLAATALSTLQG